MKDVQNIIDAQLQALAKIAERKQREPKPPAPPKAAKPTQATAVQIEIWPDAVRACPPALLRTALFGALARTAAHKRQFVYDVTLASIGGVTLRYTGQRLDQVDLDCWLAILHATRTQQLGTRERAKVTTYALLKAAGRADTSANRAMLRASILRLTACAVSLKTSKHEYIGSLVAWGAQDEHTKVWVIEVNRQLAQIIADEQTLIDAQIRRALAGRQLAQWLHSYYSSHSADAHALKVETLMKLCGSADTCARSFKRNAAAALAAVREAAASVGEVWTYEVAEKVTVRRRSARRLLA